MDRKAWIVVTLCVIGMLINGWWMATHPPAPQVPPAAPAQQTTAEPSATSATAPGTAPAPVSTAAPATPAPVAVAEEKILLANAEVEYTFTTKGGGIATAKLLTTGDHITLNEEGKAAIGSLGTASKSYADFDYRVVEKSDKHIIFEGLSADQVLVRKEYTLVQEGNKHLVNFRLTLTNQGAAKLARDSYYIYTGAASSLRPDEVELPAFVWNNAGKADYYHTSSFRDGAGFLGMGDPITELPAKYTSHERVRWIGVMSRFYTTLISTSEDRAGKAWAQRFPVDHSNDEFKNDAKAGNDFAVHGGLGLGSIELDPNIPKTLDFQIYTGAKIFHDLKKIDDTQLDAGKPSRNLQLVMFYGWFSWISRILVWTMRLFHDWTGNWGVAIILLTICVRTVLWPVQARSNATMKRMGLLAPKIKELQEKHKDDPQKVNTEMMRMYREYGVNPVGGCLPLLVQIPIFFGFFNVLKYAAELRGQSFLWAPDLSMPDTVHTLSFPFHLPFIGDHFNINPLPLLMGITMFLQMKLTPQPASADKMQQRIFMLMPFMFLFFCYSFASALALYWTAQNIYSIFQAQITRLWQKEPVLEKRVIVERPQAGQTTKAKDKPSQPRPGGGGTNSRRDNQRK